MGADRAGASLASMLCLTPEKTTCSTCDNIPSLFWPLLRARLPERGPDSCLFCGATGPDGGTFFHGHCYLTWPGRRDFARELVIRISRVLRDAWWSALVHDDGLVAVTATIADWAAENIDPAFAWVPAVHLHETGEHLEIASGAWARWVQGGGAPPGALDRGAFDRARARLVVALPTRDGIAARIDWSSKRQQLLDDRARRTRGAATAEARLRDPR